MTELAVHVLHMGLMAAAVAGIVLPLRWGAKKLRLPAALCVALWLVVLARMVLPAGVATSALSLLRWSAPAVERQVQTVSQAVTGSGAEDVPPPAPADGPVGPNRAPDSSRPAEPAPVQAPPAQPFRRTEVLPWLWLAGVLALWGYMAVSWVLLRLRLSAAVRREGPRPYWESGRVNAPFVFGLLRPRVYVPLGLEGDTLDWVLRHEYAHIRQKHHWMKAAFFLALGLHWYNPVLWLSWVLFCRDLEVHCDETVLRAAPGGQKAYSSALLALASPGRGPLLPPGFGETGVKERIRRALAYRRPGRAAVVLAVLLGVLLAVGLGCDPTYAPLPEETPDLKVQSDLSTRYPKDYLPPEVQNSLASADGVDPEDPMLDTAIPHWEKIEPADLSEGNFPQPGWTGEGYPIGFTLTQPEATLELYLDCETAPDTVACTEYLFDWDAMEWTAPLELEGPSGLNGVGGQYWMRLDRRADSPGTGMEYRLLRVACTWDNGRDTRTLEYPVLLRIPSVAADDPMLEPILMADGERLEPGGQGSMDYGKYVHITHTRGRNGTYTLERARSETGPRTFVSGSSIRAESQGGFGFRLTPMGEGAERYQDQRQYYTLTYAWEDGTEDVYTFALHGFLPRPEVDLEKQRIKPALSDEWQDLGALLPAPAEWKDQDLAGRDQFVTMEGMPVEFAAFPTAQTGWAVVCVGRGAVSADTYVYYSNDGGNSWTETGRPRQEDSPLWRPCAFYAGPWDNAKALLAFGRFEDAPVFRTTDCGQTWQELDLPVPEGAGECVEIVSDTQIVFSSSADPETRYTFYTLNAEEDRWNLVSHLEDPERIPIWELPPVQWQAEPESEHEYVDVRPYWYAPIAPIGAVKGTDIALYSVAVSDGEELEQGSLLLRSGEHLDRLPIPYLRTPRMGYAGLHLADFDGDGGEELSLILLEGTGTGVNLYSLYLLEPDGEGWRLAASLRGTDAADRLDLSRYGAPADTAAGEIVSFSVNGNHFTLSVGLCSTNAPYTVEYTGSLVGDVSYNGAELVIGDMSYTSDPVE